jgi:hypothetical protein
MISSEYQDLGIDLSHYEELAHTFPQFPIDEDIRGMCEETRLNLLSAITELRIMKFIQHMDIPPGVVEQFLSIEEEFDIQASVEQRLKAAVSWLRNAEMYLFRVKADSAEMMIYSITDASQKQKVARIAAG